VISLNGAAARKAHVGDHLIICTYGPLDDDEVALHTPKIVLLDEGNRIKQLKKLV
jgi:aspartate 1-decarboxylase